MEYYALFYEVVKDFIGQRAPYRNEHLKLAQQAHTRGEIVLAGALADPVDQALLVFRVNNRRTVEDFVSKDPYVTNGLVKCWQIRPWTVVIGNEPMRDNTAQAV